MSMDSNKKISSLLLPLQGINLLVPSAAVAEIINNVEIASPLLKMPWCIGQWLWRGYHVPVISFELANGNAYQNESKHKILAIFNTLNQDERMSFFALSINGIPLYQCILPGDIISLDKKDMGEMSTACVSMQDKEAYIPNLNMIENKLLHQI